MNARALRKEGREARAEKHAAAEVVGGDVRALVRQLITQLADDHDGSALFGVQDSDERRIILDVEVDGARYVLIRSFIEERRLPEVTLSPREQEIARMVAEGYPNKTIAAVLDISSWTVGTYLRRIFAKFGVGSRAAMVAKMLEKGAGRDETAALSLQRKYTAQK